jgi:hypothetical protein
MGPTLRRTQRRTADPFTNYLPYSPTDGQSACVNSTLNGDSSDKQGTTALTDDIGFGSDITARQICVRKSRIDN